jgi:N6-L-threonylcarbamoyladenine synthase
MQTYCPHTLIPTLPPVCCCLLPLPFPPQTHTTHTLCVQVRCEGVGRHTVMGTTIDDSMGEAFDKTARLLGINAVPGEG